MLPFLDVLVVADLTRNIERRRNLARRERLLGWRQRRNLVLVDQVSPQLERRDTLGIVEEVLAVVRIDKITPGLPEETVPDPGDLVSFFAATISSSHVPGGFAGSSPADLNSVLL